MAFRLGCGTYLLGFLGIGAIVMSLLHLMGQTAGLGIGDEWYRIGRWWAVVLPLGLLSSIAAGRIFLGYRDAFGVVMAAAWVIVGFGYLVFRGKGGLAILALVILWLIASGTSHEIPYRRIRERITFLHRRVIG